MDLDHMQKQTTSLHSDTVSLTTDPEFPAAVLRSLSQAVSSFLSAGPQRFIRGRGQIFIVVSNHILFLPLEQTAGPQRRITTHLLRESENILSTTNNMHNPLIINPSEGIENSVYRL